MAPWAVPEHARLAGAAAWLLGPYIAGRPSDLRVLRLDADADDTHDATDALGGIRCRTLVVSGGRDAAYPPDLTRELVAGLPDVRHIEYPGTGSRPRRPIPGGSLRVPRRGDAPSGVNPEHTDMS